MSRRIIIDTPQQSGLPHAKDARAGHAKDTAEPVRHKTFSKPSSIGRHWADAYVGIPFAEGGRTHEGCDCGGLVLLVLRNEKGVQATDFQEYETADFASLKGYTRLGKGIDDLMKEWIVVDDPQPFDLVRFRYGRTPCHVGIYVGAGSFLHVERKQLYARITPMTDPHWGKNFIEYRRHASLAGGL